MERDGPVSPAELSQVAQADRDRAIARLAAMQHGVVTLEQLEAIGMAASTVRGRASAGRLHRVHRGVFAVGHPPITPAARWLAAVLACGLGAVLSHCSAAALRGLRESAATQIDVTAPRRAGRTRNGICVHRADLLHPAEITIVDGIPCTTVARTVVDLVGLLSPDATEYVIHRAQARRMFDRAEVLEVLERSPSRRGSAVVRRAIGAERMPEERTRSRLERRLLAICRRAGLALPQVNFWIALPDGGGFEVDFAWPGRRLAVETDSLTYHGTYRAFENDPRRDRSLMVAGWRVARFTERDLIERPSLVAAELRRMLGRSSR
jgi:predicted transcriptional regulator of viral defense system/very-short-patch-repair endonuclease